MSKSFTIWGSWIWFWLSILHVVVASQDFSFSLSIGTTSSVPSCDSVTISYGPNTGGSPVPPYQIFLMGQGVPVQGYTITSRATGQQSTNASGSVTFDNPFPVGVSFIVAMVDNDLNSGGAIGPFESSSGTSSCTLVSSSQATVFTNFDSDVLCGTVHDNVAVSGVAAGNYQEIIISPYPAINPAIVSVNVFASTETAIYLADSSTPPPVGTQIFYGILDALGYGSNVQLLTVGSSSQCPTTPSSSVVPNPAPTTSPTQPITHPVTTPITTPATSPTTTTRHSTTTSVTPAPPVVHAKKSTNAGAIAGGVVGGLIGLAALAALIFFLNRKKQQPTTPGVDTMEAKIPYQTPIGMVNETPYHPQSAAPQPLPTPNEYEQYPELSGPGKFNSQ